MNKIYSYVFKTFYAVFNIFFIATLLIYPSEIFFATKTGLLLWYNNILPSIFAFIIGINIISASNFSKHSSYFFKKISTKKTILLSHILKTTFLGHLAGYPLGSKLTSNLVGERKINKSYITLMLGLSCACGPVFLISAIGNNIFSNKNIGYILIFTQFFANIITGYLYYLLFIKEKEKDSLLEHNKYNENDSYTRHSIVTKATLESNNKTLSFSTILSNSIMNAIETVLSICGTIVFFCILIKILQIYKIDLLFFKLISFLASCISNNVLINDSETLKAITNSLIYGLLEITNGIYYLSNMPVSTTLKISFISFLTTFGGACVHMQLVNVYNLNKKIEPIKIGSYVNYKFISAIIAFIITYLIITYFNF